MHIYIYIYIVIYCIWYYHYVVYILRCCIYVYLNIHMYLQYIYIYGKCRISYINAYIHRFIHVKSRGVYCILKSVYIYICIITCMYKYIYIYVCSYIYIYVIIHDQISHRGPVQQKQVRTSWRECFTRWPLAVLHHHTARWGCRSRQESWHSEMLASGFLWKLGVDPATSCLVRNGYD